MSEPWTRKEVIGDCTLLLGDCRDILPTLAVDHIITDPPYSDNTHRMAKTNKGAGHGVKLVTFGALDDDGFREVARLCVAAAGVWTVPVHNGAEVPTQKPLALVQAFVSDFTLPGETVCDPFLGSGTTGVACALSGRRLVGIEADASHFDIACRRIEEAYRQPRLFDEPAPKPVQDALF